MTHQDKLVPAEALAARNSAHFPNESPDYRAARNALLAEEIAIRRATERVAGGAVVGAFVREARGVFGGERLGWHEFVLAGHGASLRTCVIRLIST